MFFGLIGEKMKFKPQHKKILQNLEINDTNPGTLLHDFQVMIDIFHKQEQTLTAGHQIPLKLLGEINNRLKNPVELALKRPQQKSYPRIEGLYLVLRASGLTSINATGKKPVLIFDEDWLQQWEAFSSIDKYCHLLEAWMVRGYDEILGGRETNRWGVPRNLEKTISGFNQIPVNGFEPESYTEFKEQFNFYPETYNLGLMNLFGMVNIEDAKSLDGQGWNVTKVERTKTGEALLAMLYEVMYKKLYVNRLENNQDSVFETETDESPRSFSILKPHLQQYFPQWQKTIEIKHREKPQGVFTLKVSPGKYWSAHIRIGSQQNLDSFAMAILRAVGFDNDHLYKFTLKTRFGSMLEINHSYMDEHPSTTETTLADLYLKPGSTMTFIFDFGDWWEFNIVVEEHNPDENTKKIEILSTKGKAPEQYPNWEDFEE